jgi:hypothetical protein
MFFKNIFKTQKNTFIVGAIAMLNPLCGLSLWDFSSFVS